MTNNYFKLRTYMFEAYEFFDERSPSSTEDAYKRIQKRATGYSESRISMWNHPEHGDWSHVTLVGEPTWRGFTLVGK
jgi:hypothetical protein